MHQHNDHLLVNITSKNDHQHHHHHHHGHCQHTHHHHEELSLKQIVSLLKQYATTQALKSMTRELWTHTNLRSLYVYTMVLVMFNLVQVFVAFFKSRSLIVIFASLYTTQRVFNYIILIIVAIMKKKNMMVRDNSRHVPYVEYSYGFGRVEVILRFSNGVLAVFVAFALLTEAVHSLADQHLVKSDYVLPVTIIGLIINFLGVYAFSNTLNNSNFAMPAPASLFGSSYNQKSNPITNLIFSSQTLIRKQRLFIYEYLKEAHIHIAAFIFVLLPSAGVYLDVFITFIASLFLLHFTWPTITKAALVLLQTAPEKFKIPLSKCIREASFVEGVLECHGEHFWSIGMGPRASVIGTIKVRVSTDANEQQILQNVKNVFQQKSFISDLTIQIEKDNWSISDSRLDIGSTSFQPVKNSLVPSSLDLLEPTVGSSISHDSNDQEEPISIVTGETASESSTNESKTD